MEAVRDFVNDLATLTGFLNGLSEVREAILRAGIATERKNKLGEDLFGGIDFDSVMGFSQAKY